MSLGTLGIWSSLDGMSAADGLAFARRVEAFGYGALWMPEGRGRNVLVHAAFLLGGTERLTLASGIANIYARDAMATAAAHRGLNEQSGGRFVLGLGVSHVPLVSTVRGHAYGKPVATMRAYLEAMRQAPYGAPAPAKPPITVLAALGPRMMQLAAELADGAHTYNATPEHTAEARRILGPGKRLYPEIMVMLERDATTARRVARAALAPYLAYSNYVQHWMRCGFSDADLAGGGSDRFLDAMVAWGDEAQIRSRIRQHIDAGADHICIQAIDPAGGRQKPDLKLIELLAPPP